MRQDIQHLQQNEENQLSFTSFSKVCFSGLQLALQQAVVSILLVDLHLCVFTCIISSELRSCRWVVPAE